MTRDEREDVRRRIEEDSARSVRKIILICVAVLLPAFGLLASCNSIDTGTVGAVQHFGAVQPEVLGEGIHFTRPWPFANVIEVDVATGKTTAEASAASRDLQGVHTKVAVNWSINPAFVPKLMQGFGYGEGAWSNGIMAPAIQETVKAVSARFTAEQLITKRNEVRVGIEQELGEFVRKTLKDKGCVGAIRIANVAVTDFGFSKEFDAAIESKVKAEQAALQAENDKRKRITDAEAKAKEKTLAADAQAYQTEVESKARADAIERESKALASNPTLVSLRVAERWDGKMPQYNGMAVPFVKLPE